MGWTKKKKEEEGNACVVEENSFYSDFTVHLLNNTTRQELGSETEEEGEKVLAKGGH